MKTKSIILAIVALICFAGNAMADTDKLLASDGWTKITTLPSSTDIANNYYVIVDDANDLMLGIAKGVHQDTKWYSLGVYYQTSVSPISKDILSKTWTLETQDNGFALRNLEYNVFVMQTEWDAPYKYDTNDVPAPNEWARIFLAYQNGYWTIQNGRYPDDGYLGPWEDSNFTNEAECAANKSGDNIGKFQIYAISRTQFKQNLLDNASSSNPVDITPWYVTNATLDANGDGWESTFSNNSEGWWGTHSFSNLGAENYQQVADVKQTLTLPAGKYKISVQGASNKVSENLAYVYATHDENTVKKFFTQSTVSTPDGDKWNDMQYNLLLMMQNRDYGRVTTEEVNVTTGSLTMGYANEGGWSWDVFDNFKIYCTGLDLQGYIDQLAAVVAEANSFIESHVVPGAVETIISNAINTYNKTYETGKAYSEAILALQTVLDEYKNNTELQNAYSDFYSFKTKVEGLASGQESSDALTTFNTAVSNATTAVEAATTAGDITAQKANIRSAGLTYISSVEGQFDITFLASQLYSDWKKKDGSAAGIVADQFLTNRPATIPSFAENFEWTAATTGDVLYQTVSDLPVGYYQVGMYAMALSTSIRDTGIQTEATEGDADRSFAFANDMRTGMPIKFATAVDFSDLTILDVNVHLASAGNLTFGVQKDKNGSNWHFAQIASIIYSQSPDLTNLQATRDALVAEAQGILNGADANFLTADQKSALQAAIDEGIAANTFDLLNTATLTTLPNAIATAKSQIAVAKEARTGLIAALERFEREYNLVDGTDYSRQTMSAEAWTTLLEKAEAVSEALGDISLIEEFEARTEALLAQMDATDVSIRLFKSYKAMVEGTQSLNITEGTTYAADSYMDTDAKEQEAITALNTAFVNYQAVQTDDINMSGFLGENLDFSTVPSETAYIVDANSPQVLDIHAWEEYADVGPGSEWYRIKVEDNSPQQQALFIRANWGDYQPTLQAFKLKMLPVGDYILTFKVREQNGHDYRGTNLNYYQLGETQTTFEASGTDWETITINFSVTDNATPFDLSFGFKWSGSGGQPYEIRVDDITLTALAGDPFQKAYNAAREVALEGNAAQSAISQYSEYDGKGAQLKSDAGLDAYLKAISILENAKTITDANGNATSLIVNGDLSNTTLSDEAPSGWTAANKNVSGGSDVWIREQDGKQVYNFWHGTINDMEIYQVIDNLPNGVYRFSVDLGTNNIPEGGAANLVAYLFCNGDPIGASEQVTTLNSGENRNFGTYTCAADANGNKIQVGVRSPGHYFQMTNLKLEYIGTSEANKAETSASYLRQDYFWNSRNLLWVDVTAEKYADAQGVVVYPLQANQLIKAASANQFANTANKIVDGTCASMVITDKQPLDVQEQFTATQVTNSRVLAADASAYTICLPYALTSNDDMTFYTLASETANGLNFDEVTTTEPMKPYLVVAKNNASLNAENVTVAVTTCVDVPTTNYTMKGTMTAISRETGIEQHIYVLQNNNTWLPVGENSPATILAPFRAYIVASDVSANLLSSSFDNANAIHAIQGDEAVSGVYDLQGRKVADTDDMSRLPKGIYIINGNKQVVK